MPAIYAPVLGKDQPRGTTYYQAFVGPGAVFDGDEGQKGLEITDGVSSTVIIAEGAAPVPWTKPEDLPFAKDRPLPKIGGLFEGGTHVLAADGGGLFLTRKVTPETLRALITRNNGETIRFEQIHPEPEKSLPKLPRSDDPF